LVLLLGAGTMIVSTPQNIALIDAQIGANMFQKVANFFSNLQGSWIGNHPK
jgi:Mrp family chromosome partitioning ATPase